MEIEQKKNIARKIREKRVNMSDTIGTVHSTNQIKVVEITEREILREEREMELLSLGIKKLRERELVARKRLEEARNQLDKMVEHLRKVSSMIDQNWPMMSDNSHARCDGIVESKGRAAAQCSQKSKKESKFERQSAKHSLMAMTNRKQPVDSTTGN